MKLVNLKQKSKAFISSIDVDNHVKKKLICIGFCRGSVIDVIKSNGVNLLVVVNHIKIAISHRLAERVNVVMIK